MLNAGGSTEVAINLTPTSAVNNTYTALLNSEAFGDQGKALGTLADKQTPTSSAVTLQIKQFGKKTNMASSQGFDHDIVEVSLLAVSLWFIACLHRSVYCAIMLFYF